MFHFMDLFRSQATRDANLQREVKTVAEQWENQPNHEFIDHIKRRSMLHQETLSLLDFFARRARRGILEIGAYKGGGTAVIAKALKDTGRNIPFASVELGGAHESHPDLPTSDILADLKNTLAEHEVSSHVMVVQGWSHDAATVSTVHSIFRKRGIGLMVYDADGAIEHNFPLYRDLLAPCCILVLDDYICGDVDNPKESLVQAWVSTAVVQGVVRELGVFRWGTWFGIYNG